MAKIEQTLAPFQVPNFVRVEQPPRPRQEVLVETVAIPLRDVPESVLLEMCEDFKREVLRKHHAPMSK